MKTTWKKRLYTALELVFAGVAPLILVIVQYSNIDGHYVFKVGVTGLFLLVVVFLLAKKIFLRRVLEDARARKNNTIAGLGMSANPAEIENGLRELKHYATTEALLNAIVPVLLMGAGILACKYMEAGIIRLGNVLTCVLASYLIAVIFDVLAAREVHTKTEIETAKAAKKAEKEAKK